MNISSNTQPIHGNYRGYYTKRPFVHDPRLTLLPTSIFKDARVLDVGCNEGWVTCEIAQSWGARRVIGVDIDDTLVRAAWKRRRTVWSQQEPATHEATPADDHPSKGKKRKKCSEECHEFPRIPRPEYFPASCEHMFSPLPIPAARSPEDAHTFPHNVMFYTADWVNHDIPEDANQYDVVVAFSISKWIHLNGGDEGLRCFFHRVHSVLLPGGKFVLEPQEWETYAKARRMDAKLKENAKSLQLRPEDFERVLSEIGFGPAQHVGITGEGGFRRPVDIYVKTG
ncbi:Bin3-domain-containing protein [Obba rivulosa]|uniref:RNA methyltransferase n=1 Tax=Obba rivulosa TaxID=1052685 RepID=A0A8E2B4D1_9APHY|nr:Bin3-domain-containing protein [Obba rivulosa]